MGNCTWIPWDYCPGTQIPRLGTEIETESLGTLGTGTNIAEKVPGTKNLWDSQIPSLLGQSRDNELLFRTL